MTVLSRARLVCGLLIAVLLTAAAPATQGVNPPTPPTPPQAPGSTDQPRRAPAGNAAIADQFTMLAFDGDPGGGSLPRDGLARWQEPVRIYVSGGLADARTAADIAPQLARATGLTMELVLGGAPNLLVAVTDDPEQVFGGPLRRLLLAAFNGDDISADSFIESVVRIEKCWVLAIWGDAAHTAIKAAVVGIDARQPRVAIDRCIVQKLAASMGLLGPAGYLPRSVFAPQTTALRYSLEDTLMLRLLYSPDLQPGMSREQAHVAALAALPKLRGHSPAPPAPPPTP